MMLLRSIVSLVVVVILLCFYVIGARSQSSVLVAVDPIAITSSVSEHSRLCVIKYTDMTDVHRVCQGIEGEGPHPHRYVDRVEGYELRVSYGDPADYSYDDFMRLYRQHVEDDGQRKQLEVVRIKLLVQVKPTAKMLISDIVSLLNNDIDRYE